MSALLQAPEGAAEADGVISDHKLVAQVRRGDDRAFEGLYERYQRRIHAYVFGMVKDHQRAEDVTQEVFVSALRRMRATERPIAFKPWIYEIAKNACIDQFRRSRRARPSRRSPPPAGGGRLGARDTRRLARHVAHCQPCRREALAAGVDAALVARRPIRTRVAEKVAALLPFPFL